MIQNCVTALAHLPSGKIIAGMLEGVQLPDEYGLIAERCIAYWQEQKEPPGAHVGDLFDDIFARPGDPRAAGVRYILSSMLTVKDGLNEEYVLSRMTSFLRFNAIRSGVIDMASRLQKSDDQTLAEVEEMLGGLARARATHFEPGLSLQDVKAFVEHLAATRGIELGIPPLDMVGVQPQRRKLFCKIGIAGRGKTWFLVHVGKQAMLQHLKVAHISLEIEGLDVIGRYYQSLFSASEHQVQHKITELEQDQLGRIISSSQTLQDPSFAFRGAGGMVNDELMLELTSHLGHHPGLMNNLRIRAWPPRVLTIGGLESYLDTLSDVDHFEPDVILIDYPQLFKLGIDNYRLELGQAVENLRRIGIERNAAMVMVHQGSREGAKSKVLNMTHVAEDWSIVQTADFVVSYSATDWEERFGLARMRVDKARAPGAKGRTLILSQNYDLGQYSLSAVLMPDNYLDYIEASRADPGAPDKPLGEGEAGVIWQ
jgi:hypothetical protein